MLEEIAAALKHQCSRGRAETMLEEVRQVVARWPDYAEEAGVLSLWRDRIAPTLRLEAFV